MGSMGGLMLLGGFLIMLFGGSINAWIIGSALFIVGAIYHLGGILVSGLTALRKDVGQNFSELGAFLRKGEVPNRPFNDGATHEVSTSLTEDLKRVWKARGPR